MVGWHHRLNGHEFEQTLVDSEGQGILAYCSSWGHKESDMTQLLNNNQRLVQRGFSHCPLYRRTATDPVLPSNHLILCHPLLLLLSVFHTKWLKYWHFSLSISPSNEYSGLISSRIDWFDLAVQGTLKSLFQLHSLKALIFHHVFSVSSGQ